MCIYNSEAGPAQVCRRGEVADREARSETLPRQRFRAGAIFEILLQMLLGLLQGFDNAKKCVEDGKSQIEKWIKTA